MRSAAAYLIELLEGTYQPHRPIRKEAGYIFASPEREGVPGAAHLYD